MSPSILNYVRFRLHLLVCIDAPVTNQLSCRCTVNPNPPRNSGCQHLVGPGDVQNEIWCVLWLSVCPPVPLLMFAYPPWSVLLCRSPGPGDVQNEIWCVLWLSVCPPVPLLMLAYPPWSALLCRSPV